SASSRVRWMGSTNGAVGSKEKSPPGAGSSRTFPDRSEPGRHRATYGRFFRGRGGFGGAALTKVRREEVGAELEREAEDGVLVVERLADVAAVVVPGRERVVRDAEREVAREVVRHAGREVVEDEAVLGVALGQVVTTAVG